MEFNDLLTQFENERTIIFTNAMWILVFWAVVNIVSGLILVFKTSGFWKYLFQMNIYWNLVNLAIAISSMLFQVETVEMPFFEMLKETLKLEKILLFNAGLDIGYIFLGLWLKEKATLKKDASRISGYGISIILQGSTLFIFDLLFYFTLSNHHENLKSAFNAIECL